jgi:general secretion pathway protein D
MNTKPFLSVSVSLLLGVASFAWQDGSPSKPVTSKPAVTRSAAPPKPKPAKPPWQQFKLNPKSKLFLDFTDSNPDMVLSIFSRTSGITILKDPAFKIPLTVTSAKSVGLNEAFEILNTVLEMHQYELQKKGNLMVVAKKQPPAPPMQAGPPPQPPQEEKVVLKVYHLKNAGASTVAKVINEVYSQQALEQMVQQLQQGGGFGGPPMGMGMPGRPQPPKVVRASSDDYSNAVVVNAPEKFQPDIEKLVEELDKTAETPLNSEVFRLKHVAVDEVIDAIRDVLEANAPTGRGAKRSQDNPNPFMGFYNPFGSQRNTTAGSQTAVMVKQTNSIIVSATPENLETIRKLIAEMDSEAGYVGTTFVVKLENAKATDVADLLNKAFTERRDNGFDNPFFFIYSDSFSDRNKSEIKTDITEDGRVVNVRDLTGKVNIMADPNTNSLIVVTLPSNMKLIQSIIDQIDRVSEQVMIETVIVEANLDKTTKLGVEFNFLQGSGNVTNFGSSNFGLGNSLAPLEGFRYTLQGPDYRVFLNALQNDTRFKVLSTPRIFTSNNVKAEINVSQQVPYITSQQSATVGGLITQYDFKNVGVVLNVTPRITAAGEVSMEVTQSADDLQGFTDFNAPIINHRQASTTATVKDGETIVLGGIIRNTTNLTEKKIPLLGDLPLIGQLFRSTTRGQGQTELMVLLTPRIVRTNAEAQRLRQEQTERLSKPSQDALNKIVPPKK